MYHYKVSNERNGHYLFNDAFWFSVGYVVWILQPLKVKHFLHVKNYATFGSRKTCILGHYFSNRCNSETKQDFDMKLELPEVQDTKFS